MTNDKADFTQGNILKKLVAFMMPVLGALILQAAYGAVDLLVVGRFGSTSGLSAVSTGSQVLNLVTFVVTQTAMGIRKELSVFGDDYDTPDGSCIRDYINVVDLAKAHVIAMDRMLGGKSLDNVEIFNLGTGNGVSVLELINTFEAATGVKVPHKIVGRREGDIEKVWANPERANKVLGWKATETLADTLASAWKWQERLRECGIM